MIDKCYRCDEVISMCPCDESTYTADDEISRLRAELAECRRACSNAAHLLEQARIWDGSAWHWNPLHATAALRAWEILTAALAAKEE